MVSLQSKIIFSPFDKNKYANIIEKIVHTKNKTEKEKSYKIIAKDILTEYEHFDKVIEGPSIHEFQGVPFDFIGCKEGKFVIIELKGAINSFSFPKDIQLARMRDFINEMTKRNIDTLPYLLQINLRQGIYRLLDEKGLSFFFKKTDKTLGTRPIEPIVDKIVDEIKSRSLITV
ncbi:hypothetical protein KAX02_12185 [candidate division WOR-3 bacterium]|nr:hypothetical protein [candidate division WOR-3 bacterium]